MLEMLCIFFNKIHALEVKSKPASQAHMHVWVIKHKACMSE